MMDQIHIPPLYCPFPPAISPHVEALGQHSIAWAQRFHLLEENGAYERFVAEQHWRLIARAYPTADFSSLALVADWNTWGFFLDDVGDTTDAGRDPDQMYRVFAAIRSVLLEESRDLQEPLFASLADIWQRILSQSTDTWREQLRQTLDISFSSYLWEATNRANGITPTQESYLRMRTFTGAWLTYLEFLELIEQASLPHEIRYHPYFEAYIMAVNNVIVWANDLVSIGKESAQGDMHNLVLIVQQDDGCSLQAAVNRVAQYYNVEMRHCLALEEQLAAFDPLFQHEIQKYVRFAHTFIRANLDWPPESSRYGDVIITLDAKLALMRNERGVLPIVVSPRLFWVGLFLGGSGGFLASLAFHWLVSRRKQRTSLY